MGGTASLQIDVDGDIKRAEFEIKGTAGSVTIPDTKIPPYTFRALSFSGSVNRNPDQVKIGGLDIDFGDFKANLAGVVTRVGKIAAINATVGIPSMKANDLKKYWPPGTGGGARDWVLTLSLIHI